MASIFKRDDRSGWVLKYRDVTGRWRSPSYRTRRLAEQALATIVEQRRQPLIPLVDPEITVESYSERWHASLEGSLKGSTVESYAQRLRVHILPAFGNVKICQLHRGAIKALLSAKLSSGLAPDSVRLIHATIRAMLNAAVDDGVILSNPANRLGKVLRLVRSKATRQEEIKALDRDQLSALLSATLEVDASLYPLCVTLARAGVRIGEALALQWQDLDFPKREIRVARAISNTGEIGTPKSGHGRTVDLSMAARDVLQRHRAKLEAAWLKRKPEVTEDGTAVPKGEMPSWVFPSGAWTPMDHANVGKRFKRALKAAGLPLHHSPHDLRHTFASLLLQHGESPVYVQRMLGHASITLTVDTYGKWLPMGNKAAVDSLDDAAEDVVGVSLVSAAAAGSGNAPQVVDQVGDPSRTRTLNPEIKSLLLYH